MFIRMTVQEKKTLKEISSKLGFNVSEYIRRKLFHENDDLVEEEKYISPYQAKHNLILISVLYKTIYLVREVLKNQYSDDIDAIIEAEAQSLEYARNERIKYGYKRLLPENQ